MSAVWRAGFIATILLGLMWQMRWLQLQHEGQDQWAAMMTGAAQLKLRNPVPEGNVITVGIAGCPSPVRFGLFAIDGGEDASISDLLAVLPRPQPLYVFLGAVHAQNKRLSIWMDWLRGNAEAMTGLRHVRVPTKMVVAALPASCPQLTALDWSVLSPAD